MTARDLGRLAKEFQGWYFGGAGLYMDPMVRACYFDLQDGIRIVMLRLGLITYPKLPDQGCEKLDDDLRNALERDDWPGALAPDGIKQLFKLPLPAGSDDPLSNTVIQELRKLGSSLRTAMCNDMQSRRRWVLRADQPTISGRRD